MITREQIEVLAKDNQIDSFTTIREYLQLLFLSYLYREKEAEKIYFKGGTAIRLLLGSPRFSEDLDFSTSYDKNRIKGLLDKLEKKLEKELPGLKLILLYSGKNSIRFRLKYQPADFKYPLVIRLDFNLIKKAVGVSVSPLVTKYPVALFPLVSHLSNKQILKEKISALLERTKGRDFFDVWFLLEKEIPLDKKSLTNKLLKKIQLHPQGKLDKDLAKFLPSPQRKITAMLKLKLKEKLENLVGNFGKAN